jgi:LPS sulfotransferase NodH
MNQNTVEPNRGYLICCIERTGSNLLADGLLQTKLAGRPAEYFSPVLQDTPWIRDILGEASMITGLRKILLAATTPNGMCGVKLHWVHIRHLAMALRNGEENLPRPSPGAFSAFLSQMPGLVPTSEFMRILRTRAGERPGFLAPYLMFESHVSNLRVIWLRRKNMVARAISHYRALRSNVWYQSATAQGSAVAVQPPLDFDLEELHRHYCLGLFQEESWQWWFEKLAIQPYSVFYEDLVSDHESTLRGVFRFLDINDQVEAVSAPKLRKQADSLSDEWERRYRQSNEELSLGF